MASIHDDRKRLKSLVERLPDTELSDRNVELILDFKHHLEAQNASTSHVLRQVFNPLLHYLRQHFVSASPIHGGDRGEATIKDMLVDDFYFGIVFLHSRIEQEVDWKQEHMKDWMDIFHEEVCPAYYIANEPTRYEAVDSAYHELYSEEGGAERCLPTPTAS